MTEFLKRRAWDLIRPIHAPITRRLRRRLARNYFSHPEIELPPPYESVQLDVERHLHDYLHVTPLGISQIVIVGAHEADEVERLHRVYPRTQFLCFEPNPQTHQSLVKKFARLPYVTVSALALSDVPGKASFYEMNMPGTGSLLEPDCENWRTFNQRQSAEATPLEVTVSTLDQEAKALPAIDLLWMDIQGAEGRALAGAKETLRRTKAVFLEVALVRSPYREASLFPEIAALLEAADFTCAGLGVDAWNGAGNALFVRRINELVCKPTVDSIGKC